MKNLFLVSFIALVLTSCSNTKQVVEETEKPADFKNTIIIDDKITVSEGKLIGKTQPISEIKEVPEVPKIEEIPETPETPETPVITEVVVVPEAPEKPKPTVTAVVPKTLPRVNNVTMAHATFNTLLQNNVSDAGNVNYDGFRRNRKTLLNYINALGENLPQDNWTKNEKLAYWMNAYNAMTIDLILRNWPVASIKDINKPWEQRYWKLGSKYYNLDEIEHQILRKMGDARIHFGINCASFSCPPLLNEAFIGTTVDEQLNRVAKKFINDPSRNSLSENNIEISKIFNWFSKDFKKNGSLIKFLNRFSNTPISEGAKVRYMDYNWELNK